MTRSESERACQVLHPETAVAARAKVARERNWRREQPGRSGVGVSLSGRGSVFTRPILWGLDKRNSNVKRWRIPKAEFRSRKFRPGRLCPRSGIGTDREPSRLAAATNASG